MSKTLGSFKIDVDAGQFSDSEILVLLGENGTGKLLTHSGSKMNIVNSNY